MQTIETDDPHYIIGGLHRELEQAEARALKAETELAVMRSRFGWEAENEDEFGEWAGEEIETELNRVRVPHGTSGLLIDSLESLQSIAIFSDSDWIPRTIIAHMVRGEDTVKITLTLPTNLKYTISTEIENKKGEHGQG